MACFAGESEPQTDTALATAERQCEAHAAGSGGSPAKQRKNREEAASVTRHDFTERQQS